MTRRPFRHESEDVRRQDLVAATLDCIADYGLKGATVRQIAERAGVTPGLIRHYFVSKDKMFEAAYRKILDRMFTTSMEIAARHGGDPIARFRSFVLANFRGEIIAPSTIALWATFVSQIGVDPTLARMHRESYLAFLETIERLLQDVLEAAGKAPDKAEIRRLAIAANALLDGLWLEGGVAGDMFAEGELGTIALVGMSRLVGVPLAEDD